MMKKLVRFIAGFAMGAGVMEAAVAAPVIFDFTQPAYSETAQLEYVDNGITVLATGWAGENEQVLVSSGLYGLGVRDTGGDQPIDADAAIDSDGRGEILRIEFDFEASMKLTGVGFASVALPNIEAVGEFENDEVSFGFFNADIEDNVIFSGSLSDGLGIGASTCLDGICRVQLDLPVTANYFEFGNLGEIEYYSFYVTSLEFDDGQTVPVPGMLAIFGLGVLAVGAVSRRLATG